MRTDTWTSNSGTRWRDSCVIAETPAEYVFARPRLYLETTIPSYLTARLSRDLRVANHQTITREWWELHRSGFEIFISNEVLYEAKAGHAEAAKRRLEVLTPFPQLENTLESTALAKMVATACRLPDHVATDAVHVAIATVHDMHFLLTWNCTHLANEDLLPKIRHICKMQGYTCPTICTPERFIGSDTHETSNS